MLPPGRAAAASTRALWRRAARRPRCADRIRRLRLAALSNLHHRTLRAVPHRTRRPGDVAAGARARRALPGAARRRALCAWAGALRTRWRRDEARRSAYRPWPNALARSLSALVARRRDAWRSRGHGGLLAPSPCSGGHVARRAVAAGDPRRDAELDRLRPCRRSHCARDRGPDRISRRAISRPLVGAHRARRLSRRRARRGSSSRSR